MSVFSLLLLSQNIKKPAIVGKLTAGTPQTTFYVNRTDYTTGGIGFTVYADENGYFEWYAPGDLVIVTLNGAFYQNTTIEELHFKNLDVSNCNSMKRMLSECTNLIDVTFERFDTSNVTSFEDFMSACTSIESVDVSEIDTSSATTIRGMFYGCTQLQTITGINSWDTSNVTEFYYIFANCTSLDNLNLRNWDTSNGTLFSGIFENIGCDELILDTWDTMSAIEIIDMFDDDISVTVDFSKWNQDIVFEYPNVNWKAVLPSGYTAVDYLYSNGNAYINTEYKPLKSDSFIIRLLRNTNNNGSPFGADNFVIATSSGKEYFRVFNTSGTVATSATLTPNVWQSAVYKNNSFTYEGGTVTAGSNACNENMYLFARQSLAGRGESEYRFFIVKNKVAMFTCKRDSDGVLGMYDVLRNRFFTNIGPGEFDPPVDYWMRGQLSTYVQPTPTSFTFKINGNNVTVPVDSNGNWVWTNPTNITVTSLLDMFSGKDELKSVEFTHLFNTANCTSLRGMFYGCRSLYHVKGLTHFNTSNVTDFSYMFTDCIGLSYDADFYLNLSTWNTASGTNFTATFRNISCDLIALDNWNTKGATQRTGMFTDADISTIYYKNSQWLAAIVNAYPDLPWFNIE